MNPERIRVFKITDINWHPSYRIDGYYRGTKGEKLVEVSFLQFIDYSGWRVCAWGADDYGLEYDFTERQPAFDMFIKVITQECVNPGWLTDLGFVNA